MMCWNTIVLIVKSHLFHFFFCKTQYLSNDLQSLCAFRCWSVKIATEQVFHNHSKSKHVSLSSLWIFWDDYILQNLVVFDIHTKFICLNCNNPLYVIKYKTCSKIWNASITAAQQSQSSIIMDIKGSEDLGLQVHSPQSMSSI